MQDEFLTSDLHMFEHFNEINSNNPTLNDSASKQDNPSPIFRKYVEEEKPHTLIASLEDSIQAHKDKKDREILKKFNVASQKFKDMKRRIKENYYFNQSKCKYEHIKNCFKRDAVVEEDLKKVEELDFSKFYAKSVSHEISAKIKENPKQSKRILEDLVMTKGKLVKLKTKYEENASVKLSGGSGPEKDINEIESIRETLCNCSINQLIDMLLDFRREELIQARNSRQISLKKYFECSNSIDSIEQVLFINSEITSERKREKFYKKLWPKSAKLIRQFFDKRIEMLDADPEFKDNHHQLQLTPYPVKLLNGSRTVYIIFC